MPRRAHSLNHSRRIRGRANRARRAHVHRTMRFRPAVKVVTLNRSGEPATFRLSDDFYDVAIRKLIDEDLVADICTFVRRGQTKLFKDSSRWNSAASLFKVAAHRLVHVLQLHWPIFDQAQLNRVIAILAAGSFFLHDDTGPGLDDGHRSNRTVRGKQLRHANFFADDSVNHVLAHELSAVSLQHYLLADS